MEYDEAVKHQEITEQKVYKYRCCVCKVKRETRKVRVAEARVCTSCVRARVLLEWEKRQIPLF